MSTLWTPPHATPLPRAAVPAAHDIRLADGRLLRYDREIAGTPAPGVTQHMRRWIGRHLVVVASLDSTDTHGDLLHISVSRHDRLPLWEEVRLVRDAFAPPTVDMMMVLPREEDYVNLHQFCFHLWQTPVGWGIR